MARIMVTLDGSSLAEQALPQARAQLRPGDELLLLRVTEGKRGAGSLEEIEGLTAADQQEADAYLARLTAQFEAGGAHVGAMLLAGDVANAILQAAHEQRADLLVMSSHGRRGWDRWVTGSVAEQVARQAPCPVWLVRASQGSSPTPRLERFLLALDGSERTQTILGFASGWLRGLASRLLLLSASGVAASELRWNDRIRDHEHKLAGLRETLESQAVALRSQGWDVDWRAEAGLADECILRVAEEEGVDGLVLASHGRTGLNRWLLGSVAEQVFRRAPCPVVILKANYAEPSPGHPTTSL